MEKILEISLKYFSKYFGFLWVDENEHRFGLLFVLIFLQTTGLFLYNSGSCHKRQKPQAPMPQAPIRYRQTRKVANAKCLNRNTNPT